jgi:hypothetical protein
MMNDDIREIIRGLVGETAREWVSDQREFIDKMIRESMIPEMRKAVRERMVQEVKGLVAEEKKTPPPLNNSAAAIVPSAGPADQEDAALSEGLYVYGVVQGKDQISLGSIGLETREVFTVAFENLAAVVHRCPARPYQSSDEEEVKAWVAAHQQVVDAAWEWFGNVVPAGFDTILQGRDTEDVMDTVRGWLRDEHDHLEEKLRNIDGMAEYGIQVFWDTETIARTRARESPDIRGIEEEIHSRPRGVAHLYRQKLEKVLKQEMERVAEECFQDFHSRIRPHVKALRVEKNKPASDDNTPMLMNLSCLASRKNNESLGTELEKIQSMEGFSVRFTGPWPPYGFV